MLDGSVDWWIYFNTFLWTGVTIIFDHSSGRCSSYKIILKSTCKSLYILSPPALRSSADTVSPTGTLRFFIAPTVLLICRMRFYGLLWMGFFYWFHLFHSSIFLKVLFPTFQNFILYFILLYLHRPFLTCIFVFMFVSNCKKNIF